MEIYWSRFAIDSLASIFEYYQKAAGKRIAKRIKSGILKSTNYLLRYPKHGQIEENLIELGEGHRYIVRGNYKIIYKNISEGILNTDVFDTRQDHSKLIDTDERK